MTAPYGTLAAAKDPWVPFDKGGGKGGGVIPEAGTYGLAFVGFCLVLVLLARWDKGGRSE